MYNKRTVTDKEINNFGNILYFMCGFITAFISPYIIAIIMLFFTN